MLRHILTSSTEGVMRFSEASRVRPVILALLFALGYMAGVGYHLLVQQRGLDSGGSVAVLYHIGVLVGYGMLWILMSYLLRLRTSSPIRIFWTTIFFGLCFLALGRFTLSLGHTTELSLPAGLAVAGFDIDTGAPLTIATVFKMNIVSLLEVLFSFLLLLRLRDLVLFKRTVASQRNWRLMLFFMLVASVSAFLKRPGSDIGVLQGVAMVPAVGLMVVNSFRLSWIVYLPFRQKMTGIGLAVLLLVLLGGSYGMNDVSLLPGAYSYLSHYSYPLTLFSLLAFVFGILYCTTAFLSLLFHLPTTGDFQQKAGEVAAMHSLTTLVNQALDPERLVASIVASPVEAGAATGAWLSARDLESGSLRPRILATHHIAPEDLAEKVDVAALFDEVSARRKALLIDQAAADHRFRIRPSDGFGSVLGVPLITQQKVLAVLFVTKAVSHGFEKDDVEAVSVFAAQAALALDHARLFREQVEKERLSREIDIAQEVQRKLMPQRLPTARGVVFGASNVPAQEVGGDYYDFVRLDENRLAFIVADVSGKGTSAAFYMATMQGIFQSASRIVTQPVRFLTHANDVLSGCLERHVFISVIYGVIDTADETVTIARAGHCPAAMIRIGGDGRFLRTRGLGLGLDRSGGFGASITEERIRLQPGDVFALYTDGVVESRNPAGEEYGYERLMNTLAANRHEEATVLHDTMIQNLRAFTGRDGYDDDMTMLVIKWHGSAPTNGLPDKLDANAAEVQRSGRLEVSPQP